ncbi:MAG: hypothetical protein JXB05_08945 [Myxococcaceae bacterium]|nr:hypothetical protein [Myxococcaceae bacterium]
MRAVFLIFLAVLALPEIAAAAPPQVRAKPERVLLGQDTAVELRVQVPEGAGPVRAAASTGSFAQEVVEGGEERAFRWAPPDIKYPLMAILVFWEEVPGSPPELAVVRIPLVGRTMLPITTDPGAEVVIEISEARFGPVKADRRGRAKVPVEVPPGVKDARVLATRGELKTDRVVPLEVPVHRPLLAVLSPDPLPRAGGWLVVVGEERLKASELELSADGARLEVQQGALVRYRVSPQADAKSVSVEVRRRKAKDTARAQAPVSSQDQAPPPISSAPAPASAVQGALALHLLAGGFFAGGANQGPAVALGASFPLPLWSGRLAAEVEVGLRRAALDARIDGYGVLHSRVLAGPVLASARLTLLERSAFAIYGRVGAGILPFQHEVSSDFQPGFDERKLGGMAFLAAQGAWRLGRLSLLMELRGEYGPARTARLDAQLGGAGASLGLRYEP